MVKKRKSKHSVSPATTAARGIKPEKTIKKATPVYDRPWKIAQLAASLASNFDLQERGLNGLKINPRIAGKEMDAYFAAALKRADTLLSWAEGKGGGVHAYQLFEEGSILTEEEIMDTFRGVNWGELKSKQPVMNLMNGARQRFESELSTELALCTANAEMFPALPEDVESAIRNVFSEHFRSSTEQSSDSIKGFVDDLTTAVREKLGEHFMGSQKEKFFSFYDAQEFKKWCFPDPEPDAKSRAKRLYRPHAIFRRCAARKWFDKDLVRSRELLSSTFIPYPPIDLRREEYEKFENASAADGAAADPS